MLAGINAMPINVVIANLFLDRTAGELRPNIADNTSWLPVDRHKCVQFAGYTCARYARVGHQTQVLAAAVDVHGQHTELT